MRRLVQDGLLLGRLLERVQRQQQQRRVVPVGSGERSSSAQALEDLRVPGEEDEDRAVGVDAIGHVGEGGEEACPPRSA